MIQRSDIGKKIRQYFIDVENQWNSPEAVMETFDSVSYRDFCNKIRDTFGVKENEVRDYLVEQRLIYKVSDFNGKTCYKPYKDQQMLIDYFAPTVALDNPA